MSEPAPVTLRITDGCEGRAGALAARSRALQCLSVEARVSSIAIVGKLSFDFFMLIISIYIVLESCIVWVSIILGLVLCYCLDYIFKNCYMPFLHANSC